MLIIIVLTSQPPDPFTKGLILKQTKEDMKIIIHKLMIRDINKKLYNLLLYLKKNKIKAILQLLYNLKLRQTKLKVTKKIK